MLRGFWRGQQKHTRPTKMLRITNSRLKPLRGPPDRTSVYIITAVPGPRYCLASYQQTNKSVFAHEPVLLAFSSPEVAKQITGMGMENQVLIRTQDAMAVAADALRVGLAVVYAYDKRRGMWDLTYMSRDDVLAKVGGRLDA